MKSLIFILLGITACINAFAQTSADNYPKPEFSKEVYWYNKSNQSVMRLEKGLSKMDTKTKAGGMGGAENSYSLEGAKSSVRLTGGENLSFV